LISVDDPLDLLWAGGGLHLGALAEEEVVRRLRLSAHDGLSAAQLVRVRQLVRHERVVRDHLGIACRVEAAVRPRERLLEQQEDGDVGHEDHDGDDRESPRRDVVLEREQGGGSLPT
jgi:hypothetical protein